MELLLIVILLPELLIIVLGFCWVCVSLCSNGDVAQLRFRFSLPRKNVASGYWGDYAGVVNRDNASFALPKILKEKEPEPNPNWTGE